MNAHEAMPLYFKVDSAYRCCTLPLVMLTIPCHFQRAAHDSPPFSGANRGPRQIAAAVLGAALWFMFFTPAQAQTPGDLNEGTRLELDAATGIYHLKWWGRAGKSYFIQHSDDLLSWEYLPLLPNGDDNVLEWGLTSSGDKLFLRLKIHDDPFGIDSDGDGMSDAFDVLNGLDPHLADGALDLDGDGSSNSEDARPNDNAIGRLSIAITAPGNNSVFP